MMIKKAIQIANELYDSVQETLDCPFCCMIESEDDDSEEWFHEDDCIMDNYEKVDPEKLSDDET